MEADWEVELGGGARVIDGLWPGFVDLRRSPELAHQLTEVPQLSGLAETLVRLNAMASPVWTSKCDVWPLAEFDPDELDVPPKAAHDAMACYIDLLPKSDEQWATPAIITAWCKGICIRIRALPLRFCRLDLVVRSAHTDAADLDYGVTAYLSAAGCDPAAATQTLSTALAAFADSILPPSPTARPDSKLQLKSVGE